MVHWIYFGTLPLAVIRTLSLTLFAYWVQIWIEPYSGIGFTNAMGA